jgi:hypothetical protein
MTIKPAIYIQNLIASENKISLEILNFTRNKIISNNKTDYTIAKSSSR